MLILEEANICGVVMGLHSGSTGSPVNGSKRKKKLSRQNIKDYIAYLRALHKNGLHHDAVTKIKQAQPVRTPARNSRKGNQDSQAFGFFSSTPADTTDTTQSVFIAPVAYELTQSIPAPEAEATQQQQLNVPLYADEPGSKEYILSCLRAAGINPDMLNASEIAMIIHELDAYAHLVTNTNVHYNINEILENPGLLHQILEGKECHGLGHALIETSNLHMENLGITSCSMNKDDAEMHAHPKESPNLIQHFHDGHSEEDHGH